MVGADLLRKTLAFLSFQMAQEVSMVRDEIALQFGTFVEFHHELMESCDITHSLMEICARPS
jgi:hypothetical protein